MFKLNLITDKTYDKRHTNICTIQTNIQSKAVSITCFVYNRICPIYQILFPIIITINDVFVIIVCLVTLKIGKTINCKILSFCHVTNMGVSTTEMNSNMWSVLTNSKSADFIISMLYQMLTYWPYQIWTIFKLDSHLFR